MRIATSWRQAFTRGAFSEAGREGLPPKSYKGLCHQNKVCVWSIPHPPSHAAKADEPIATRPEQGRRRRTRSRKRADVRGAVCALWEAARAAAVVRAAAAAAAAAAADAPFLPRPRVWAGARSLPGLLPLVVVDFSFPCSELGRGAARPPL
jgi:hypothetical protein